MAFFKSDKKSFSLEGRDYISLVFEVEDSAVGRFRIEGSHTGSDEIYIKAKFSEYSFNNGNPSQGQGSADIKIGYGSWSEEFSEHGIFGRVLFFNKKFDSPRSFLLLNNQSFQTLIDEFRWRKPVWIQVLAYEAKAGDVDSDSGNATISFHIVRFELFQNSIKRLDQNGNQLW